MKLLRRSLPTLIALAGVLCTSGAHAAGPMYRIDSAVTLQGQAAPNWDYLAFDPATSLLYVSLRQDGALVYDTKAKKVLRTLDDSKGANAFVLLPESDRGFVINQDGSTTLFELATHKTLKRVKFAEEADNGFYDPSTRQVLVTTGGAHEGVFLDPKTAEVLGRLRVDSSKLEGTAPDGKGSMFMALRDRNKLLRIDMNARSVSAEWPTPGCEQHKLYTANGVDANLTIVDQVDADTYKIAEVPTTRPYARTMALDLRTKAVWLVTAEGTVDTGKKWGSDVATYYPNTYFKDTFTVLSLQRR